MDLVTDALYEIGRRTGIHVLMNSAWGWPTVESLHFLGLSMLIGAVGLFDLRMLGVGRGIPMGALHRMIPWGIGGYGLNVLTGFLFVTSAPDQYLYNPAFQIKLSLMAVAGVNVLFFYRFVFVGVKATAGEAAAPRSAKVAAAVSLTCWIGVIVCGRLITYYRPPYHWCWWC
jgi:hypothetical protein